MEDHIERQLQSAFSTSDLYDILKINKLASVDEIKSSYRKLALRYHPDKGGNPEQFKALSITYSILSDPQKRTAYDTSGSVDDVDNISGDYEYWYNFYRELFPKITINDITSYQLKYQNSEEEKTDIITYYDKYEGDIKKVIEFIPFIEEGDELRLCEIINKAIDSENLSNYPKYQKYYQKLLKNSTQTKKRKTTETETTDVDDLEEDDLKNSKKPKTNKKQKEADDFADLQKKILNKSNQKSSFNSILKKYGGESNENEEDIPDDEFEAIQKNIKGKASKTGKKKVKK